MHYANDQTTVQLHSRNVSVKVSQKATLTAEIAGNSVGSTRGWYWAWAHNGPKSNTWWGWGQG